MRQSSGQKIHFPGQPAGAVSTVTGATPLWVRMGFMRMRRMMIGIGLHIALGHHVPIGGDQIRLGVETFAVLGKAR